MVNLHLRTMVLGGTYLSKEVYEKMVIGISLSQTRQQELARTMHALKDTKYKQKFALCINCMASSGADTQRKR